MFRVPRKERKVVDKTKQLLIKPWKMQKKNPPNPDTPACEEKGGALDVIFKRYRAKKANEQRWEHLVSRIIKSE